MIGDEAEQAVEDLQLDSRRDCALHRKLRGGVDARHERDVVHELRDAGHGAV